RSACAVSSGRPRRLGLLRRRSAKPPSPRILGALTRASGFAIVGSRPVPLLRRARTRGFPPSGNGASSFHLGWRLPQGAGHLVSASVTLEVLTPPVVDDLYFWALQVTFPGAGAAHLGLQWNHRHPAFGAVNWRGYAADGSLLAGTESPLPSTPADPNTPDYAWEPGPPSRLRVHRTDQRACSGAV